jgi:hypothetical protein
MQETEMPKALSRGLVAATIAVVVLTAALTVLCPQDVHLGHSGGVGPDCLLLTHSGALGTAIGSQGDSPLLPVVLALGVGLAMTLVSVRPRLAAARGAAPPAGPLDPLSGRLRL